ncbi:MAG: DUF559 domain-containing protein [Gemmatimonadota bacterium]
MSSPVNSTDTSSQLASGLARVWTPAEREAWRILERGILGYSFRRHALMGGAVVGFYCPELGIILQMDADSATEHPIQAETCTVEGVQLKIAHISGPRITRALIVDAIERAVSPGRLWPED